MPRPGASPDGEDGEFSREGLPPRKSTAFPWGVVVVTAAEGELKREKTLEAELAMLFIESAMNIPPAAMYRPALPPAVARSLTS